MLPGFCTFVLRWRMLVYSPQPCVLTSQTLASTYMLSNHDTVFMSCAISLTCRCIRIETKMQVLRSGQMILL